ncbi:methyltransferase domain-containing protein [Modestobacter sp. I12A-02628]|uniref:Methyltransferase domain-containing protein n=1 Tax=Goekera deserti TaxID=2497753 RepID=A0A7K3WHK0_9ACTN|nr:methyltransferase [Goekera deserti]MPQ97981.1 methyltransferase domain-containing protein [Goekera deserti]NDI48628.1 methyltransferase domain-containing protein [Goekera deserti]NEL54993.1 methyltransferase domain-containing protein [Goekera deserti]
MRLFGPRYTTVAPCYDLLSAEWPVYLRGRRAAFELLDLRPGERVLDVGCGTGLDLPFVRAAGATFHGVDASPQMLGTARRRARGWSGATFLAADATSPAVDELPGGFDAVVCTYALSIIPAWPVAFARAVGRARPGARVVVVDMQPASGPLRPLADLAMRLGGVDPDAHPWTAVEQRCTDVEARSFWSGHVQLRLGTLRT